MVFSSLEFIFRFMPVFFLVYFLVGPKYRNIVLLVGSLLFYAYGEPKFLVIMVASIIVNYYMTNYMDGLHGSARKNAFIFIMIVDFGILFIFKYLGFVTSIFNHGEPAVNITLPLGISFYTFQMASYVIDIYREKEWPAKNIYCFACYVSMFPQLIAGPIVTYNEVQDRLEKKRKLNIKNIEDGLSIFIIGMALKVVLANNISGLWNQILKYGVLGIDTKIAWLGAWAYSFQLYFDFFGYSLMAIGLGKMLGYKFPENFNNPYVSKSVTEFWRRWHITLGRWFREYIYIPLGGSINGTKTLIKSSLAVWAATGIWHGANWNFIIWGLMFFVLLMIEKFYTYKYLDRSKVLGHLVMLVIIPMSWMVFYFTNLGDMGRYLLRMLGVNLADSVNDSAGIIFKRMVGDFWWLLLLCVIFSTPYPIKLLRKYKNTLAVKIVLLALFWISIYYLATSGSNPFLYFRF